MQPSFDRWAMVSINPVTRLHVTAVLLIVIGFLALSLYNTNQALWRLEKANISSERQNFSLLDPSVARLEIDEFLEKQKTFTVSYATFRQSIEQMLKMEGGEYGVYFEDLTTGAWFGINEKGKFWPASLLKVPTMVAILKEVEEGRLDLNQSVTLQASDLDSMAGALAAKGTGYKTTIVDLLRILIKESDNTANKALLRHISQQNYARAWIALGMHIGNGSEESLFLSPKEYITTLRSLYMSSYLRRPFSQLALSLMIDTEYESMIPAGISSGVKVAHKVGMWTDYGSFHDCGIIYEPDKPYMLCIMSKNVTEQKADEMTSRISRKIYEYVKSTESG